MTLSEYNRKRIFKRTPEPKGIQKRKVLARAALEPQLRFVIQKHHASRLHYDFRLELDGTLKSWAVPKGPSLDPNVRRLAMMVEDHPISYMRFEGTIPRGNYGAGDVIVWDIGVYHSSQTLDPQENIQRLRAGLKKGHIDFVLFGQKLKGHFSLVKIHNQKNSGRDDNRWLLMKHADEYSHSKNITAEIHSAISNKILDDTHRLREDTDTLHTDINSAKSPMKSKKTHSGKNPKELRKKKSTPHQKPDPMPHDIHPMLATLIDTPFDRKGWIFEFKWDGYRALAEIENGTVNLYSRNGNSYESQFPPIYEALMEIATTLPGNVIFDGEIIALKKGRPDFHALQNYDELHPQLHYVIFDLLYYNGKDLRDRSLQERKHILKEIFPHHAALVFSEHVENTGTSFFNAVTKMNYEGIMAKDMQSTYIEGQRSHSWLKLKHFNEQEAVIVGFTEPRGSRKKFGALVLAAYDHGALKYIGHSGGGFTDKKLAELHGKLRKIIVKDSPFPSKIPVNSPITWVQPKLVCQMKFSEWTPDGRMRHPIYMGMRNDKDPKEVVIEKPDNDVVPTTSENMAGSSAQKTKSVTHIENKNELKPASDQKFTNLTKVFWPKEGYTKGDVIDYYRKISEIMLPYLKDRPESLHRHPNGIEGKSFFHKDIEMKVPEFVHTEKVWSDSNDKEIRYLLCNNVETLLYMANLGCIEINPWNSRIQNIEKPDYMIIDLDPGDNTFDELIEVALIVKDVLEQVCDEFYCKTSGKTGLHILVPTGARYDYPTIRIFSELVVRIVHKRIPNLTSIERSPAKRKNKIYLDYLQNRRGQTIAAPYSLRPWPGATVSTPLRWKEVKKGLRPEAFTLRTIFKRLEKYGDILEPMRNATIDLEAAVERLQKILK